MSKMTFDGPPQCGIYVDSAGYLRVACQCGKCYGGRESELRISIQGGYATGFDRGCALKLSSAVGPYPVDNFTFDKPKDQK